MGMDVSSETAVLVVIDDMAGVFNSSKLARAFAGYLLIHCKRFMIKLTAKGRILVNDIENDDSETEDRGEIKERLEQVRTGQDLFTVFVDLCLCNQKGEVGKYGDTYFENEDELRCLLNLYLFCWKKLSGSRLPRVDGICTYGSGRLCDWAVDRFGYPYISFSPDDVFEQRLTVEGSNLQKALGVELSMTTITDVDS